jgi:hypothetical protein
MDKKEKIRLIESLITESPRFQQEYGFKLKFIKIVLPILDQELIDKIYGFLILEQNTTK